MLLNTKTVYALHCSCSSMVLLNLYENVILLFKDSMNTCRFIATTEVMIGKSQPKPPDGESCDPGRSQPTCQCYESVPLKHEQFTYLWPATMPFRDIGTTLAQFKAHNHNLLGGCHWGIMIPASERLENERGAS